MMLSHSAHDGGGRQPLEFGDSVSLEESVANRRVAANCATAGKLPETASGAVGRAPVHAPRTGSMHATHQNTVLQRSCYRLGSGENCVLRKTSTKLNIAANFLVDAL